VKRSAMQPDAASRPTLSMALVVLMLGLLGRISLTSFECPEPPLPYENYART
jgi:hypothetical protein